MKYLVLIIFFLVCAPHAQAVRIWQAGTELNSITAGVEYTRIDAGLSTTTAIVHSGMYAVETNAVASTMMTGDQEFAANQTDAGFFRAYVYCKNYPNLAAGTGERFMQFSNAANAVQESIYINTDGTLTLRNSSSIGIATSTAVVPLNQWNYVELQNNATAATGVVTGRLNGVQFGSANNNTKGSWARTYFGLGNPAVTEDCIWDDVALNDNTGSSQTSWPGAGNMLFLSPTSQGESNQWSDTSNSAGTTNNWTLVNETPPNDATTMVQTGTVNNTDWYINGVSPFPNGVIVSAVTVSGRLRNNVADASTAVTFQAETSANGTVSQGTVIVPNTTTWFTDGRSSTIIAPTLVLSTDPSGNPWTLQSIMALRIGPKLTTASVNRVQVTRMWAYVDYIAIDGICTVTGNLTIKGLFNIL